MNRAVITIVASRASWLMLGMFAGGLLVSNARDQASLNAAQLEAGTLQTMMGMLHKYRQAVTALPDGPARDAAYRTIGSINRFDPGPVSTRPLWMAAVIGPDRSAANALIARMDADQDGWSK